MYKAIPSIDSINQLPSILYESMNDGVLVVDQSGIIIDCNPAFHNRLGYQKNEVIGLNVTSLDTPEFASRVPGRIEQINQNGKLTFETAHYRKNGTIMSVEISSHICEMKDEIILFGIVRDISRRKQVEDALRNSETHLKTLIKTLPDLVWLKDPDGIYLGCNRKFERFFGAKEEEIIGKTDHDFVDKDLADFFREKDELAVEVGGPSINEEEITYADDGHIEQLEVIKIPMFDVNGEMIGILGVGRDITTRKRLEAELKEHFDTYQAAINTTALGFWVADSTGHFVDTNETYLNLSGYSREELMTMHISDVEASESPEETSAHIDQIIQTGYGRFRTQHRTKQGTIWPVEVITTFSKVQGGCFFVFLEDITETIAAERQIARYNNQLEALVETRTTELKLARDEAELANKAKSEFLSSMSHELRTPLNAVLGFSQLLEMNYEKNLTQSQLDNVVEINTAGNHLLNLINEILDLSKIESGQIELEIESVALKDIMTESLNLITPLAKKRGIKIRLIKNNVNIDVETLKQSNEIFSADYTRMKQVIINLLSNAIKYNKDNGEIIINCNFSKDNKFYLGITDTGIGIANEQQEKLFKSFKRLNDDHKNIEGTGIGLVITKKLVEIMGGVIGFESKYGEGSTFWVELPYDATDGVKTDTLEVSDTANEIPNEKKHQYKVLYIEDNPANLRLVKLTLKYILNVTLLDAHEPSLGLELAIEHKPDLILLDINLPGMNGFDVLKKIKNNRVISETSVFAISANAMPNDIKKGLNAGFDEYITKPINISSLLDSVKNTLERKS